MQAKLSAENAVSGAVRSNPRPNVVSRHYFATRQGHTNRMRAFEMVLEFAIDIARPVRTTWRVFKDFDLWQKRFGYRWDVVPADHEDSYACLTSKADPKDLQWQQDYRATYIVRKVIPERLIYFDNQPLPLPGKDGVWTGHNVMALYEEQGKTKIVVFMEHTFYSETMSIEELQADGKQLVDSALAFWNDYFIPDLTAAVESTPVSKG